jgi:hypothetical protein
MSLNPASTQFHCRMRFVDVELDSDSEDLHTQPEGVAGEEEERGAVGGMIDESESESESEGDEESLAPVYDPNTVFEVELVFGRRAGVGCKEYHVKWAGYGWEESSWEEEGNFFTREAIDAFEASAIVID